MLEGLGTLRIGGEEIRVCKGDYVALPAGAEGAHQLVNSSEAVLRYPCFSTMVEPDTTAPKHKQACYQVPRPADRGRRRAGGVGESLEITSP